MDLQIPIDHIVIDGMKIDGDKFKYGTLSHNINDGTVTITFVEVRNLEVVYGYMADKEK